MNESAIHPTIPSRFDRLFWGLYEAAPQPALDLVGSTFRYALPAMRLRVPITIYRGASRANAAPATLITAGTNPWLADLRHRFFQGQSDAQQAGHYPVWALPEILQRYESTADLIVARVDRFTSRVIFPAEYLPIPEWIDGFIELPDDPQVLFRNNSVRDDVRRIRKGTATCRVSRDEADFDRFYHEFHVPFVSRRHGELVHVRNIQRLRRMFRRGGLLWIERDGRRLAGLLFELRRGSFRMVVAGMDHDDAQLMHDRIPSAMYYHGILLAHQLKCRRVDLGGIRPLLNDGVLLFKRKWSAHLMDKRDIYHDYMLRMDTDSPAVRSFLRHSPLIYQDRPGLSAIAAMPLAPRTDTIPLGYPIIPGLRKLTALGAADAPNANWSGLPDGTELICR